MTSDPRYRSTIGYYASVDVLPEDMATLAYQCLGSAKKVTFGTGGSDFTKTEGYLPEDLVWRIRDHLDGLDLECRTVLVSRYRVREVPRHVAYTVARDAVAQGCTIYAAADAVGYHSNTLLLWKIRRGSNELVEVPGDAAQRERYLVAGRDFCASRGEQARATNAAHYAWVGWVRERVVVALAKVRDNVRRCAEAGGPVSAVAAVYQVPVTQVQQHARWRPSHKVGDPPVPSSELQVLATAGRTYCLSYKQPTPSRYYAWVGWLIATSTDMQLAPIQGLAEVKET